MVANQPRRIFAAGEVSGSHGVYRPGGTALNAGQVGSTRAAQYIAANRKGDPVDLDTFRNGTLESIGETIVMGDAVLGNYDNVDKIWQNVAKRMSRFGAAIRRIEDIRKVTQR